MRKPRRIRALAIDIDGTLLDSRFVLSEANRAAVAAAHQRGIKIVLVTGRRHAFAQPIAAQLQVQYTLISSNGALVRSSSGVTLDRQLLPHQHARAVLAAAGPARRDAFLLFDREGPGQIVAEHVDFEPSSVRRYLERNREYLLVVEALETALSEDPIQVLFIGVVEPMRRLYEMLSSAPCSSGVSLARTEYVDRDLSLVDVLDRACNKGAALARWGQRSGLDRAEVMAIGDNWNDCDMLEWAGLPVLMGNSSDELKQRGWAVTDSCDKDGVARAIEEYLLRD
jgi:Cof subfamily protein (haloacid dehalogenase superfamily)